MRLVVLLTSGANALVPLSVPRVHFRLSGSAVAGLGGKPSWIPEWLPSGWWSDDCSGDGCAVAYADDDDDDDSMAICGLDSAPSVDCLDIWDVEELAEFPYESIEVEDDMYCDSESPAIHCIDENRFWNTRVETEEPTRRRQRMRERIQEEGRPEPIPVVGARGQLVGRTASL